MKKYRESGTRDPSRAYPGLTSLVAPLYLHPCASPDTGEGVFREYPPVVLRTTVPKRDDDSSFIDAGLDI